MPSHAHPLSPCHPAVRLAVCGLLAATAAAQGVTSGQPVIVVATRTSEDPFDVPYTTAVVDRNELDRLLPRTLPQALRYVPGVMVQETMPGQGSPYMRGFTGYGNVMLVDGVRLNNSAFRSGPNQYWNTVDPLSIDRLEIVKGTGGVLYGSDAIGGVVQAMTRSPWRYAERGFASGGSTYVRYATAEDSLQGRAELSLGQTWEDGSRTGLLLGGDAKAFGDMEGGAGTGRQGNTGYEETAFDVKLEHRLGEHERLVVLHQQLAQADVPRTHATNQGISWRGTQVGTDRQRDFDQNRTLTYLQYHRERMAGRVLDGLHANVSWHQQDEFEDRIRSNGVSDMQGFDVGTLGLWLQLESVATGFGRFTAGVEWNRDFIGSQRRSTSPATGDEIQGTIANDATYDLASIYLQDEIACSERASLLLGSRLTHAGVDADSVRDPVTRGKFGFDDSWNEVTSSARLRFEITPRTWSVFGGVSQGFRAPSLYDLTAYDTARSGEYEIPATGLQPEHYLQYEVGTKLAGERLQGQLAWFYTDIADQVQRYPTGNLNGSGQREVTKANIGSGSVQGIEADTGWLLAAGTTLFGAASWQYGRVENYETAGTALATEPITRMMPFTARVGMHWEHADSRLFVESDVVHAEKQDKLSFGDRRDTQRVPPGGTPGYWVWNVRAGWRISDAAAVDCALENLTDYDYRIHGSGSNMPGRSLVLAMRVTF